MSAHYRCENPPPLHFRPGPLQDEDWILEQKYLALFPLIRQKVASAIISYAYYEKIFEESYFEVYDASIVYMIIL
jgi:hypothetical protein